MPEVGDRVTIDVVYVVEYVAPHPEKEGVWQYYLRRPKGRRIYFALLFKGKNRHVQWTRPIITPVF